MCVCVERETEKDWVVGLMLLVAGKKRAGGGVITGVVSFVSFVGVCVEFRCDVCPYDIQNKLFSLLLCSASHHLSRVSLIYREVLLLARFYI